MLCVMTWPQKTLPGDRRGADLPGVGRRASGRRCRPGRWRGRGTSCVAGAVERRVSAVRRRAGRRTAAAVERALERRGRVLARERERRAVAHRDRVRAPAIERRVRRRRVRRAARRPSRCGSPGVGSTLPVRSIARTSNVCDAGGARPAVGSAGSSQRAQAPGLRRRAGTRSVRFAPERQVVAAGEAERRRVGRRGRRRRARRCACRARPRPARPRGPRRAGRSSSRRSPASGPCRRVGVRVVDRAHLEVVLAGLEAVVA